MKHGLKLAVVAALAVLLTGCRQMHSTTKVKPDGSGTVAIKP
jgi:PBP1b-binding outer membrane lipoprotein LpoB